MEIAYKTNKKKKLKKSKIKLIIILAVLVFIFISVGCFFKKRVNPTIYSICSSRIKMITSECLNNSVKESYVKYGNLNFINIKNDASNKPKIIETDSASINNFTSSIIDVCNDNLKILGETGIKIPLGALLGIPILASVGPSLNLKFVPLGNIVFDYDTKLETGGVNQTVHKIYLNVNADVTLIYGLKNPTISTQHKVLICETIIIGDVPNFVLNRV